jgi:hypothetical protein
MAEGLCSLPPLSSPLADCPGQVEWDLLDDLFSEVNPWEVLMAVNRAAAAPPEDAPKSSSD